MRASRVRTIRLSFGVPKRFDLRTALFGHGFVDLAPNRWLEDQKGLCTILVDGRRAADVWVQKRGARLSVSIVSSTTLGAPAKGRMRDAISRMLRLGEDLAGFHALCRSHGELSWVERRHAGALMKCPTPFEDLAKVLLTTNTSWANTRAMVGRLASNLGARAPSGGHAFPSAVAVGGCSEAYLKEVIRVGYRAKPLLLLAHRFAATSTRRRFEEACGDEQMLRDHVLGMPGFGPYAAGQIARLYGHYRDFALDSWCVATLKKRGFRASSCTERALARRYRAFGEFRGLAFWCDLTAPWHGEGPHAQQGVEPLSS
jgi:3-methyladenine DNA glycosylase/8-oxoguanine DNA glycosylase